jgi:hypothetical protein
MGCKDDCFERRRKELSVILKKNINNIRDEDVVTSFLNSVMPIPENVKNSNDNYMLKYLRHGKIEVYYNYSKSIKIVFACP